MSEYLFVASHKDLASENIARCIIRRHGFKGEDGLHVKENMKIIFWDGELVHADRLSSLYDPTAFIFLSKHRSESKVPALTSHFSGNLTIDNILGGRPRQLSIACPYLQKMYLKCLFERKGRVPNYQITIEPTHHGPTSLQHPLLFIELGSSEENWNDERTAEVIADAIVEAVRNCENKYEVVLAIGGPYYSEKFTECILNSDYALGHVCPKYLLQGLDREMIEQMAKRSSQKIDCAVLDWKGLGTEKQRILSLLNEVGLKHIRL